MRTSYVEVCARIASIIPVVKERDGIHDRCTHFFFTTVQLLLQKFARERQHTCQVYHLFLATEQSLLQILFYCKRETAYLSGVPSLFRNRTFTNKKIQ